MEWFRLSPIEAEALRLSLVVAVVAVAASLPFGIVAGWFLARRNFFGKSIIDGFIHLPLVIPPVVTGYVLLLLFGRNGPVGGFLNDVFGVSFAYNWKGAALASAVMAFPLMVRAIRLSVELVDRGLEDASRTLGASGSRVFFTITLPLITPGIITGVILAFARSLGEFGATITFVSNIPGQTRTLPVALFSLVQTPGGEAGALRLCVIAVVVAMVSLIASETISRRMAARIRG